jgi:hypothetical protein
MGESSILKGRHYMQLFILALLFMFAIFTRKSIWIYYVRCRWPTPRPLSRSLFLSTGLSLVHVFVLIATVLPAEAGEGGGGDWLSCVVL